MKGTRLLVRLERRLSGRRYRALGDALTLLFLLVFVVGPPLSLFPSVLRSWGEVYTTVFADPFFSEIGRGALRWDMIRTALLRSFEIAAIVTVIDILIGLPMALILARYDFRGKRLVDTLVDLPMAVPTAALGFSLYLFWSTVDGLSGLLGLETGLVSRGPLLIILTHVAFSYPYIVRSLKEIVGSVDRNLEYAARTLGAPPFTVFRTVTAPLIKSGVLAGAILSFTRSLGETGATLIVAGAFYTAPLLVVEYRQLLMIPPAAFLSMILVSISAFLLASLRFSAERFGLPIRGAWPRAERLLSGRAQKGLRDLATLSLFALLILIPSCFIVTYLVKWWSGSPYTGNPQLGAFYQVFMAPDRKLPALWSSIIASFKVAAFSTVVNIAAGLPMAFIIARRGLGRVKGLLDALVDIPLTIPTSALGFSFFLFWGSRGLNLIGPGFWMIVLVHIGFTYPYIVRPLIAVVEGLDSHLEEAARTLGAPPLTVFRTVILPSMKEGILAAAIMAFTRSLGETGATIVVMGLARTVPVLIVQWVESLALPAAAFACIVLIAVSLALLLVLRYVLGWE
ncbi:MAG: ABC transporter permease [Candidatus Bathyarchaeia archaeon]